MTQNEMDDLGVGLADAIDQVRAELERATSDGGQSEVAFRAGPVQLEFEVAFTKTGGVDGGFRLSVLALGAKRERSSVSTHRIHVSLTPVDRQGHDKLISDAGPLDAASR